MPNRPRSSALRVLPLVVAILAACSESATEPIDSIKCDVNNGGITLPAGFCATVVADLVMDGQPANARHMVVTPSGDLFVAINNDGTNPGFGIIGLRDADGDGHYEQQTQFSPGLGGSGITWSNGVLYFGANDRVMRYALPDGQLTPTGNAEVVVSGLPSTGDHVSKTVLLADAQTLLVNIGSATNSCQVANRIPQSPGISPCPELAIRAGVWAFNPTATNQTQASGRRYATGYRNLVALAINPRNNLLYGAQHGRDMLFDNFPQFYTAEQSAELPAEEFAQIGDGTNNGWPYCYYDALTLNKKVLAPEYGGDGNKVTGSGFDCSTYNQPLATLKAHWAPNGLHFYSGTLFPAKYQGGAFVALHGGHDRAPLPNEGFNVMFIPMGADGKPSGAPEVFADGFAVATSGLPATAVHRPVGVAEGPDGSLFVSDDKGGRIWKIIYRP
ncbi:MAG: PQQ-dependent sugar dehydrogenase [bacterium]